jgi:hypothetical protein
MKTKFVSRQLGLASGLRRSGGSVSRDRNLDQAAMLAHDPSEI